MTLTEWCQKWGIPAQALTELQAVPLPADDVPGGETAAVARIRLDASADGVTLWRNNSGVMLQPASARGMTGRPVRFGLGNESSAFNRIMKSSDLIGIAPGGRFVAIEVKREGWTYKGTEREVAQQNFLLHVIKQGGSACFASSWVEAKLKMGMR